MQELVGRLAEVDPDAGAAVKVIVYFDRLVEGGAGLEPIVRGAAVLAGCAARLVDDERGVSVRVDAQGRVGGEIGLPDPEWLSTSLLPGGPPVWMERSESAGPVEAMVLERAASAARSAFSRMRGRAAGPAQDDPARVAMLLDASVAAQARLHAGRQLGIAEKTQVRAVAMAGGQARVECVAGASWPAASASDGAGPPRAGIGPTVGLLDLPASLVAARTALRLTAEGTEQDPGATKAYQ